jgi:regulator of protease activity HflC (stomatin/prohibitin superfamily)
MAYDSAFLTLLLPLGLIILFLGAAIRILPEYQRGVVFFLGRFQAVKGPGLIIIVPAIQQLVRVDLRVVTMDVPEQDLITKDNVTVRVNAVLYFKVVEPEKAIIQVEEFQVATSQLAQTTLRSVLGQHDLDELLSERERLNRDIQGILDDQTDAWGIKVVNVEIKHVDLNENMIRAIARQAEAERNRRAKVINAEGELQASERLHDAAAILSKQPQALQLRYLQTLADMSSERATTVVFPLPLEWLNALAGSPGSPDQTALDKDDSRAAQEKD